VSAAIDKVSCIGAWTFNGESSGDDPLDSCWRNWNKLYDTGSIGVIRGLVGPFSDECAIFASALDMQLERTEASQIGLDLSFNQGKFTVMAYAYCAGAWPASNDTIIMAKQIQSPATDAAFKLYYDSTARKVGFSFYDFAATTTTIDVARPSNNTWFHLAATRGDDYKLRLYLDGVLVDTSAAAVSVCNLNNAAFTIGVADGGDFQTRWPGWIDEAAIFMDALSQEEIYFIYKNGLTAESDSLLQMVVDNKNLLSSEVISRRFDATIDADRIVEPSRDAVNFLNPRLDTKSFLGEELDAEI
jgi:hypothetical protein